MAAAPEATGTVRVDHSALRTNQAFIIGLLVLAFVLNRWPLVASVALVMLIGTAIPSAGLFKAVYFAFLRPAGLVRPDLRADDPAPHRFAQAVGGAVTLASALTLAVGWQVTGWALSWLVVALAGLNLFAGICVGCLLYYQLGRLRVPGFTGTATGRS